MKIDAASRDRDGGAVRNSVDGVLDFAGGAAQRGGVSRPVDEMRKNFKRRQAHGPEVGQARQVFVAVVGRIRRSIDIRR